MSLIAKEKYLKVINTKKSTVDCSIYNECYWIDLQTNDVLTEEPSGLTVCLSPDDFEVVCMAEVISGSTAVCFNRHIDCDGNILGDFTTYPSGYTVTDEANVMTCAEYEKLCCKTRYETIILSGDIESGIIDFGGHSYNKIFIDNYNNKFDIEFKLLGDIDGNGILNVRRCVAKGKEFSCAVVSGMTYEFRGDVPDCIFPIDIELINDCSSLK